MDFPLVQAPLEQQAFQGILQLSYTLSLRGLFIFRKAGEGGCNYPL
ncbi:hypothetical protein Ppha_2367 [Pelodictyon phaeoclathratiforme BU-1]|jgi:hypothetical protein|uniref:Uncharacterized protein n=1 Tax=Pelodictyon phaeoclathratiforme (strain DSM 5477 / BU-1) TaxID=324925 RepID=B4SEE0_PELPB|nr:hypothetical protein Ppha_2367 [Pelodictyon phaeoclathratiforme BU-1]